MVAAPVMAADRPPSAALDVQHVARLASLTLTGAEASRFQAELATILAYVAQLDEVDTRDVPPTAHVQLERLPLREDAETPCLAHDEALAQAPEADDEGFVVPAFVE
jgi:aspartyl-tRNA(Asn)/glutamyl-tRNA(Gln) amidotransferase subunit C